MSKEIWYYEKDNLATGPITEVELLNLIKDGSVKEDTLVWSHPMDDWTRASEVEELKPLFPLSPPPLPQLRQPPPLPGAGVMPEHHTAPSTNPFTSVLSPKRDHYGAAPSDVFTPSGSSEPSVFQSPLSGPPAAASSVQSVIPAGHYFEEGVPAVRPWVRYAARCCDFWAVLLFWSLVFSIVSPGTPNIILLLIAGPLLLVSWIPVEALFLALSGTTPGKYLLNTKVVAQDGGNPSYSPALGRSIRVWFAGQACGIPLLNFVTWFMGYDKLTSAGKTSWDEKGGFTVTHEAIGGFRAAALVLFTALIIILIGFDFAQISQQ